jgi:hypothetical protein
VEFAWMRSPQLAKALLVVTTVVQKVVRTSGGPKTRSAPTILCNRRLQRFSRGPARLQCFPSSMVTREGR